MPVQPVMNSEKWRRKTLPSLKTGPAVSHYEPLVDTPDSLEGKKPRVFTKALRSLSNSSMESVNTTSLRSSGSMRRLQKPQSASTSMIERLHRRVSRDSPIVMSPAETPGTPMEQPFSAMELIQYGHLKTDISLLKARSEYLVLTDQCLIKMGSIDAARGIFPQLTQAETQAPSSTPPTTLSSKAAVSEVRFEIPLRSIVAVFKEEGASPRFGIEVWWFSQSPKLAYCKAHLFFSLPKERDVWLANIQRALKARLRRAPVHSTIPENLKTRINHIVGHTESQSLENAAHSLIFPVAKRTMGTSQKANTAEEAHYVADGSSFYLVLGPCMCYFVEVLKAEQTTPAGDLRVKSASYGTVTLARFRASVASHEQRFVMSFRPPFGREIRLDLASTHYRRIIEALTRVDRIIKPMWPQHFQQFIFDIKGLPPPLQLTSGNDLGGLERSLQAYCTAFQVKMPRWKIDWRAACQPAFRLIPSDTTAYSSLQLLAVFRALRYNSFFKAISFQDVDMSSLAGKRDPSPYSESVVHTSLNGWTIPDEHYDILLQAPVLTQEVHALAFASESIRSMDFSNVLGPKTQRALGMRTVADDGSHRQAGSEMLRPLLLLARSQLCVCHSISVSDNALVSTDVDDLANVLVLDHVYFKKLELANCGLGDAGLSKLWTGLSGQAMCLEVIDTSHNQGIVKFDILRHSLNQLCVVKKVKLAGNTRISTDESLFEEAALNNWHLTELDLSGIALNDATIDSLCGYLETINSQDLQMLCLNQCGLTGRQIARLFRAMGQARKMTVHVNASRLDEGIDDLCGAIACGYGPWSWFVQMVEFSYESSYIKLWKALTVNKTIECLSLAGSATPDAASSAACQAVSDFFASNDCMRFLDISGYDAKLDEGRLGKEFSRSLGGLRTNSRLEHLRVRSQMLNVNTGDLADAISSNTALHTLDCEDNGFNLSNFRHLVKHLHKNSTIRHFSAFSQPELHRAIQRSVDNATPSIPPTSKRTSMMSKFRTEKTPVGTERPLLQQLKTEWDIAVSESSHILERNQGQQRNEMDAADESDSPESRAEHEGERVFSNSFGGLALRDYESLRVKDSQGGRSSHRMSGAATPAMMDLEIFTDGQGIGVMRTNSTNSSDDAAISPTSYSGSFLSNDRTPPEGDSPTEALFRPFSNSLDEDLHDNDYIHFESDHGDELQMRPYRRPWSDSVSRIDEEEDGN